MNNTDRLARWIQESKIYLSQCLNSDIENEDKLAYMYAVDYCVQNAISELIRIREVKIYKKYR